MPRLLSRFRRSRGGVTVLLTYADGSRPTYLGPMDRFTAEVFIVNRMSPNPHWEGRRVATARIVS